MEGFSFYTACTRSSSGVIQNINLITEYYFFNVLLSILQTVILEMFILKINQPLHPGYASEGSEITSSTFNLVRQTFDLVSEKLFTFFKYIFLFSPNFICL